MSWRVANSLDVLLDEINDAAPNRSKISDGSIGDAAHASRDSDHNPWVIDRNGVGVVRARDFTHDPAGGLDCNDLARELEQLYRGGHPALGSGAYTIWRRRILSRDRLAEGWRTYSGSNPHDHHLHQSVARAAAGYDSTAPWGVMKEEDVMASLQELERLLDRKLSPIKAALQRSRERDRRIREAVRNVSRGVVGLSEQVADDATRAQIRRLRGDIADLEAALDTEDDTTTKEVNG